MCKLKPSGQQTCTQRFSDAAISKSCNEHTLALSHIQLSSAHCYLFITWRMEPAAAAAAADAHDLPTRRSLISSTIVYTDQRNVLCTGRHCTLELHLDKPFYRCCSSNGGSSSTNFCWPAFLIEIKLLTISRCVSTRLQQQQISSQIWWSPFSISMSITTTT